MDIIIMGPVILRSGGFGADFTQNSNWNPPGLLFGAMLPYAFAVWTMVSVGEAANAMVKECLARFPKIMGPEG